MIKEWTKRPFHSCWVRSGYESNMKFNNWTPHFYVCFSKFRKRYQQKKGYPRSVKGLKNGLRFLFNLLRLGQVREAIKRSEIEALVSPIHLLAYFGQKFKKYNFRRNNLVPTQWLKKSIIFGSHKKRTLTFLLRYFCQ